MPFEQLNIEIDVAETITRYIFDDVHFAATTAVVKPKAWMPAPDNQTSVSRITNLAENEVWELGREEIEPLRNRIILARADIAVRTVIGFGLRVESFEPPPRHANVGAWPTDKDAKKSIAQLLAAESCLGVRPK